jgi:hypothetical protein
LAKLVTRYGKQWPRNRSSFEELEKQGKGREVGGIYVLYDGSMPVYVGKGGILNRLVRHRDSTTRGQFWDYFSWFEIRNSDLQADAEALLLKTLPYYLRLLNRQQANFHGRKGIKLRVNEPPDFVKKPKFLKIAKRKEKKKR